MAHRWKPIEDLPENWREMASAEVAWLRELAERQRGRSGVSAERRVFSERLARRWSIETGEVEGIYRIERGITEILVESGIRASLIPHGTTDRPAEEIVEILRDHEGVLEALFDFVASRRDLSTSYVRQLHQALCAHQETAEGRDAFGNRLRAPLAKGQWKRLPNNPMRPGNGGMHECCPPEQVASEMDRLVSLHLRHVADGVPPEIEAAWLHHRFVQIHPFQDGNGRMARALATLVLIRGGYFPFVVDRPGWGAYIDALEKADEGDIRSFADLMVRFQKRTFLAFLGMPEKDETTSASPEEAFASAAALLAERRGGVPKFIEELADGLFARLTDTFPAYKVDRSDSSNEHWFARQTVDATRDRYEYAPDARRPMRWVRVSLRDPLGFQIVLVLHCVGKDVEGPHAMTAIFIPGYSEGVGGEPPHAEPAIAVCPEPFVLAPGEPAIKTTSRLNLWLTATLLAGLARWKRVE